MREALGEGRGDRRYTPTMPLEAKVEPLAFSASFEVPKPLTKDWAIRASARLLQSVKKVHPMAEVEVTDVFLRVSIIVKLLSFQYGMESTVIQIQKLVDELLREAEDAYLK
jgi:hypothetical protein